MALKDQIKSRKSGGALKQRAKTRANEPVAVKPEDILKEEAMGRISAPSPLPTQIKAPLPDYPYIRSYARIPALRKGGLAGTGQP